MSFPAYTAYKDFGVEWLGEIPEHWAIFIAKRMFGNVRDSAKPDAEQLAATQAYGVIPQKDFMERNDTKVVLALSGTESFRDVRTNDFVISLRSFQGGIEHSAFDGCVSPAYTVLRRKDERNVNPSYFRYLFKDISYISALQSVTTGIREGRTITYEQFGTLSLPVAPVAEQAQIARFLDHETARIDALIEEQQRLIELLKGKRQAVISHAVTRGLDPTVPMKDSGVEWLGEVPQHWQVGALGYFAGIDTGATPDRGNPEYWGGDIPWIKTGEVNYDNIFQAEEHITHEGVKNSAAKIAPKGTLLIAMYGQGVTRGRVAILDIEAAYNQACAGVFVDSRIRVEYLRLFFIAAYPYIRDGGNETSQMNLSSGHVAKIKITVPPINEQISAEHFLNTEMARFDSLINEAGLLANHLQERRSALISAAVTGKIDIRGWESPASAKVQELEEETM